MTFYRFNGPSSLVFRGRFLRPAEGYENLWLGLVCLVLYDGAGQIAEFSTNTIYMVRDTLRSMFKIGKDMLPPVSFNCSGIFHSEVVADADMVLNDVVIKPLEPFVIDEPAVCDRAFDMWARFIKELDIGKITGKIFLQLC